MRSYGQYCAVARALDVIGDRWTLLIARELLIRGGCRYTDLRHGLPGIATNLLADRLRELEEAGLVRREAAPPPIATTLFHLTSRGEDLAPVIQALGFWGSRLMGVPTKDDVFRSHWLAMPLGFYLGDHTPDRPPITIEVRSGDHPMIIETVDGTVRIRPGTADHPDAVIAGPPELVMGVLSTKLDLAEARARGLRYDGSPEVLRRVQPPASAVD